MGKNIKDRNKRPEEEITRQIEAGSRQLVIEKGFSNVTLNQILEKSGTSPLVFYKRYMNLDKLFDIQIRQYDYWLADIFERNYHKENITGSICGIFEDIIDTLNTDKFIQRIIEWHFYSGKDLPGRAVLLWSANLSVYFRKINEKLSNAEFPFIFDILLGGLFYAFSKRSLTHSCSGKDTNWAMMLKEQMRTGILTTLFAGSK